MRNSFGMFSNIVLVSTMRIEPIERQKEAMNARWKRKTKARSVQPVVIHIFSINAIKGGKSSYGLLALGVRHE